MFTTPLRLLSAAALAAGTVLVVSAPVSAAPKPCAVGKWQLTKYTVKSHIDEATANGKGGQGTRLTITKKTAAYDFTKAKKVVTKGVVEGDRYTLTETFKKKVAFKSTLIGSKKKGSLSLKPKSATGGATVSGVHDGDPIAAVKLAKHYKAGRSTPFVPTFAQYTCTGKTLKLVMEADGPRTTLTSVHQYRRV